MKKRLFIAATIVASVFLFHSAYAFEGRIRAAITQGNQTTPLLYTLGSNMLRIEVTFTNRPHPVDLWNLHSKALTLMFPHNRSYVRLSAAMANPSTPVRGVPTLPSGAPAMPMPRGVSPQSASPPGPTGTVGPTNLPGTPAMPPMPQRPNLSQMPMGGGMPTMPMPRDKIELKATGDTTNLLGYACTRYELQQLGETMDIWATRQLFAFQPYVRNQPHRFGPRMIEQKWGGLLKAKKMFPLLATLKFDNGVVRFRFEVTSITPQKLTAEDAKLFEPPANYFQVRPLPF